MYHTLVWGEGGGRRGEGRGGKGGGGKGRVHGYDVKGRGKVVLT